MIKNSKYSYFGTDLQVVAKLLRKNLKELIYPN